MTAQRQYELDTMTDFSNDLETFELVYLLGSEFAPYDLQKMAEKELARRDKRDGVYGIGKAELTPTTPNWENTPEAFLCRD